MTSLWCVCGSPLDGPTDYAYNSHFFAAADWAHSGEQILDTLARLLQEDEAPESDEPETDRPAVDLVGGLYACDHCGRRWLRTPDGRFVF